VVLVPFPITATDLTSPIQAAAITDPDAIMMLTADTGCKGAFDGMQAANVTAQVYYVGACAVPKIVDEAGPDKTDGSIFNVEGPAGSDNPDPDFGLYRAVVEKYGDGLDPVGAGTVTFRSFMNLYRVLDSLGDEPITSESITTALRSQVAAPSFMGHPYTCDGEQLAGLPALCSPQQVLAQLRDGQLQQLGDWIDVGAIYGEG
jgi:branched-chain amino acid transport system substrate-binding protein